jgi:hypothetical protein
MIDTIMNLCPCPHVAVFKILKNIDLPSSLGAISFPAAPVPVIVEIILSGADLKDPISGNGPGEFVFEGAHFWFFFTSY